VYRWEDMEATLPRKSPSQFDFFLLYPLHSEKLSSYVDSIAARVGPIEKVFHVEPSFIDCVLHELNPDHNATAEAWVYRPLGR
jgi:hypothetical protein